MGSGKNVWDALRSMVVMEERINSQAKAMEDQQRRIERITERVIRMEGQLDLLVAASGMNAGDRRRLP
jgi:hypothetical protein